MIGKIYLKGNSESKLKIVTFKDGTDEEIAKMLEAHYAGEINISDYWAVGDTRVVHLNAIPSNSNNNKSHVAQNMTMIVIGINHDDLKTPINGKSKAAITVQCRETLGNKGTAENVYYWGKGQSAEYTDNWSKALMRTWMNTSFINALSSELQLLVKTVKKKNLDSHTMSSTINTEDKAFWLSYSEVFGSQTNNDYVNGANPNNREGTQYQYYQTSANRHKYINNNGTGLYSTKWFLRSPGTYQYQGLYNCAWLVVNTTGKYAERQTGNQENGSAPAFCL